MEVLGGGAVSYERGNPVIAESLAPQERTGPGVLNASLLSSRAGEDWASRHVQGYLADSKPHSTRTLQ